MITLVVPLIAIVQPLDGLTAATLYVPAAVRKPKLMALPVPITGAPDALAPLYS